MPELPVTAEMIGPGRTQLDLSPIENVMLWPHDPEQRSTASSLAAAVFLMQAITPDASEISLPTDVFRALLGAPALDQFQEKAKLPFGRGVVAGLIFLFTLEARATGRNRNLQQIKGDIARQLNGQRIFQHLSNGTIENEIWAIYRSVAHIWGAFIRLVFEAIAEGKAAPPFPCDVLNLPQFLSLGEALRMAGEQCELRQRRTLLDPAKTWRVPPGIPLPAVNITWGKLASSNAVLEDNLSSNR